MAKDEREELAKVFKAIDKNGDGHLTKEELKAGYEIFKGPVSDMEIERVFQAVDTDESGYIEFTEFVVACAEAQNMMSD